jgi:signal transduction histidine kinase
MVLLIAIDITSRTVGLQKREGVYLIVAALASVAVVALVAFARVASSPPELRTLRFLAVLLPSVFILCIEVILYFVEVDEAITEAGEHIFATAILSAGAIPFSLYVFHAFSRLRDELAYRAQSLESLHETSMSVTGETSPPRLYRHVASGARDVVGADRAALLLVDDGSDREILEAVPSSTVPGDREAALMRKVRETGKVTRETSEDLAVLSVPVRRSGRVVGAMAAINDADRPFTDEDELLLEMFGVATSAALENVSRLEEAQLLATIEERERIARDLHDDLGQLLGFLTAKIQAAGELIASGRTLLAQQQLSELDEATRTLGAQVREAILGLRARVGPDRPLRQALEDYVSDFGIQAGLSTQFVADPDAGVGLPASAQYQLLCIAQEALSNARRHAEASHVSVRLTEDDGYLELRIADDGRGFDPAKPNPGFGLKTMEERLRTLDGRFEIDSTPGTGTVVTVRALLGGD